MLCHSNLCGRKKRDARYHRDDRSDLDLLWDDIDYPAYYTSLYMVSYRYFHESSDDDLILPDTGD
jgi:hypothetical protein